MWKTQRVNLGHWWVALWAMSALIAQADVEPFTQQGSIKVYHSVFNSSMLQPEVAKAYGLVRSGKQALLNVAVVRSRPEGDSLGLPAKVSGSVVNLMQQQKSLPFREIKEPGAVYYLAPIALDTGEESVHFKLQVELDGETVDVEFTRRLYEE